MEPINACPACESQDLKSFYRMSGAPVHSVLLLASPEEAIDYPQGEIELAFCRTCGFIFNARFDPDVQDYAPGYEATQGYSETFSAFHRRLAESLAERFDLRGKRIIEIGCGNGDFLTLLCELTGSEGIGFDPAYVPGRVPVPEGVQVCFERDFYGPKYAHMGADFYACKMTLEHIQDVAAFVRTVRQSVGERPATVFFQIPEVRRVLGERAFWDIYYEHCSYFSKGSLARLFRRSGFEVLDLWTDYDDQYLMIAARPAGEGGAGEPLADEDDLAALAAEVERFSAQIPADLARWRERMGGWQAQGKRVVLWGGGSKGVAFLTTLGLDESQVQAAVDINPHKTGFYMAGTGQVVVSPQMLPANPPGVVIVMNPIYCDEIGRQLDELGIQPELVAVVEP